MVSCPSVSAAPRRALASQADNDRESTVKVVEFVTRLNKPCDSPRRPGSTAPTCSTSTRVRVPSISISGLKEAGSAWVDVGAMMTVESASNSSACRTIPYRRPACSCPVTALGARSRKISPRCTKGFHHLADSLLLGPVPTISACCSASFARSTRRLERAKAISASRTASDWLRPDFVRTRRAR